MKKARTVQLLAPLLLFAVLAGCGTPQMQRYDSRYLTYEHGSMVFGAAMDYASRYCAQAGLRARHVGTDSPPGGMSLSRFECTAD